MNEFYEIYLSVCLYTWKYVLKQKPQKTDSQKHKTLFKTSGIAEDGI